MKRRIAIILLLLAGGAVVNVAVAWGCALWSPLSSVSWRDHPRLDVAELLLEELVGPNILVQQCYYRGVGSTHQRIDWKFAGDSILPCRGQLLVRNTSGWPLLSFSGQLSDQRTLNWAIVVPLNWYRLDGARSMVSTDAHPFLPARPVPRGFIINTLFYALLLWLLFFAPLAARRMLRRRRGLCEKCAYPIGVSPVCTECGAAVPRKVET